jgi:hypothetical protein
MEMSGNRRLLIAVGAVLFFVIVVLVWYFFYAKPAITPSLGGTNNPLPTSERPPRFQFISKIWNNETSTSTTEVTDPLKQPLVKIWDKPATGQTFIIDQVLKEITSSSTDASSTALIKKSVRATSTILLFTDKITGYTYGHTVETGNTFQITNTIIPGVHDSYFFDDGKRVIIRYADQDKNTVVALIANLPPIQEGVNALPLQEVQYLTGEVMSVAVNKESGVASYVVATQEGSATYTISPRGPVLVASSPFREWVLSNGGDTLYVTSKPSAYIVGATFSLPLFESESGERTGLIANPTKNGLFLNSMWSKNGLVTFFSKNGVVSVAPFTTLASKCSWGTGNALVCAIPRLLPKTTEGLPDDWFQGRVLFSDDLYTIDTNTGEKYTLYTFTEKEGNFDITNTTMDSTNHLLGFTKKQDGTLWLLNTNLLGGE